MKPPTTESHRHFSRVPFFAQVSLDLSGQTMDVDLLDIALKGALVRTSCPVPVALNDRCRLNLPLAEGGESIQMNGKVAHLEDCNIGIACEDIDLQSLTQLRRLLELNTGDADQMNRELSHMFVHRPA